MVMATNMTKDDVLFVVSTSGQTKEVVELMQIAKDKGAAVILLTQHGSSPASRLADILLTISVEEQHIRIGTMSARIAQLAIVDAMFIRLCIQKGNQVFERIIDTHNVIQKSRGRGNEKMKVLFVCSGGMSSAIVVKALKQKHKSTERIWKYWQLGQMKWQRKFKRAGTL